MGVEQCTVLSKLPRKQFVSIIVPIAMAAKKTHTHTHKRGVEEGGG